MMVMITAEAIEQQAAEANDLRAEVDSLRALLAAVLRALAASRNAKGG